MINRLEVVTLSLLRARPRTGYDIAGWLGRHGPFVGYRAQPSQVYRQLKRLEEAGWTTTSVEQRDAAPDARVHVITDAGSAELDAWIDSPYVPPARPLDPDLQVRLRFSAARGPAKLLEIVRIELDARRASEREARLGEAAAIDRASEDLVPGDASAAQHEWMREAAGLQEERGHLMTAALIAWLEVAERRLAARVAADAGSQAG